MTDFSEEKGLAPTVTVVIPNWNGMQWLPDCLTALINQSLPAEEIILVDNASSDGSYDYIRDAYPQIKLIRLDENRGFATAVNLGIAQALTTYVALLNTDTIVHKDWIRNLVLAFEKKPSDTGAISPLLVSMQDPDKIDNAGDSLSWYGEASKNGYGQSMQEALIKPDIFSPSGGATMYRRTFLRECGGFDEQFFAYLEDVDLGLRGRLMGYQFYLEPASLVTHYSHGAGINYHRYIRLVTKNRLLLFIKNIPFSRLVKYFPKILYGQIYYFLAFGKPLASLAGYWDFLRALPRSIARRTQILKKRKISLKELDRLLLSEKPGEGIKHHLSKLLKRMVN